MTPVDDVQVAAPVEGRREIGLIGLADDEGHRAELLVVGGIEKLRRRLAADDEIARALEIEAPGLQVRQLEIGRQFLNPLRVGSFGSDGTSTSALSSAPALINSL